MDYWTVVEVALLFLLVALSGFFSCAETALVSLNKLRLRKLVEDNVENAVIIHGLLEHPNKLLATILVGNTIVNTGAASIATAIAIKSFGSTGIGIATGIMTFILLVFGEITPKGFAIRNSEKLSLLLAKQIELAVKILQPIVDVLSFITKPAIEKLGGEVKFSPYVTEDEIKMLVDVGEEEGVIEKEERELIHSIFEFTDKTAKDAMVPRTDMNCIDVNKSLSDAVKSIYDTRHSRTPVYQDNVDNVVGILYSKDLFQFIGKEGQVTIKDIMKAPYYVPESKKLGELLKEFQKNKIQMAIVLDEYGGTSGVVTLEDVLEEIVGEILDEYDQGEPAVQIVDERTAVVDAKVELTELNKAAGTAIRGEKFETVSGLIFRKLGRIPSVGDKVKVGKATISVEKMRGKRIAKVRVVKD